MRTIIALLLLTLPASGQKNDLGVFGVGNFYPITSVRIWNGANQMFGSSADTVGLSAEYRYCWQQRWCVGFISGTSKTDGRLYIPLGNGQGTVNRWPLQSIDAFAAATQKFPVRAWTPYVQEGFGYVVTRSLVTNSGISSNAAFLLSLGIERAITPHWSAELGDRFEDLKQGCYGDNATPGITYCSSQWAVRQQAISGVRYNW